MMKELSLEDIVIQIRKIFEENIQDFDISENVPNDKFLESVQINSIASIKIIVAIEDTFKIDFDNNMLDVELFKSLDNLASYILEKIHQG